MRRHSKWILGGLAALCAASFIATFPIRAYFAGQSAMVQVVRKDSAAGLFEGESSLVKVGSPQRAIVTDRSVLVAGPDKEILYADQAQLDAKGLRPLQLQTVDFLLDSTRIGLGVGFLALMGLGYWLMRRRPVEPNRP